MNAKLERMLIEQPAFRPAAQKSQRYRTGTGKFYRQQERPGLHIPAPSMDDYPTRKSETENEDKPKRGVIVIDLQLSE